MEMAANRHQVEGGGGGEAQHVSIGVVTPESDPVVEACNIENDMDSGSVGLTGVQMQNADHHTFTSNGHDIICNSGSNNMHTTMVTINVDGFHPGPTTAAPAAKSMAPCSSSSSVDCPIPISLKFVDVVYSVSIKGSSSSSSSSSSRKSIIQGVSGHVLPGEMLALMGPSGSGKTTLLNLLSGRLKAHSSAGNPPPPHRIIHRYGPSAILTSPADHRSPITFNGLPYSSTLKQRMGFVTQDDVLHQHLTVKETLIYAALLRLPRKMSRRHKCERAMDVIHRLGLHKCQDTVIGGPLQRGISGGERKRVCVGHEILIDPSILFLDEPTSGLDSTTALRLMQILHDLAKAGRTVITTIHQPSSRLFYMFDKLILLGEGRVIYSGKAEQAMDYFSSIGISPLLPMNPADFLLDLASGSHGGIILPLQLQGVGTQQPPGNEVASDLVATDHSFDGDLHYSVKDSNSAPTNRTTKDSLLEYLFQSYGTILLPSEERKVLRETSCSCSYINTNSAIDHERQLRLIGKKEWSSSWWLQFSVLFSTGIKERRHEYLSVLQIMQVMAISFVIGSLWWQSNINTVKGLQDQVGLIFFISTYWGMFPLYNALFTFPQEKVILAKERASDMYRLSAYFLARILADALLNVCLPTLFLLVVYFMAGLKATPSAFILTLLMTFATAITSQGLGLTLGAALMNVRRATSLASVILLTFMLAGGFFVQKLPAFIEWIKNISFNYYSFDILVKVQYEDTQTYNCSRASGCESIVGSPALHGIELGGASKQVCILLIMLIGYHILAYIFLRRMKLGV